MITAANFIEKKLPKLTVIQAFNYTNEQVTPIKPPQNTPIPELILSEKLAQIPKSILLQAMRYYDQSMLKKGWQDTPFNSLTDLQKKFALDLFHLHLIDTQKE